MLMPYDVRKKQNFYDQEKKNERNHINIFYQNNLYIKPLLKGYKIWYLPESSIYYLRVKESFL